MLRGDERPYRTALRTTVSVVAVSVLVAVSAQRAALPEGWVASGGSSRRRGGLAEMTEKACDAGGFSDQSEQTHGASAARAGLDVDVEGSAQKLGPGAVAATAPSSRCGIISSRLVAIPIAGRRLRGLGDDELSPFGVTRQDAGITNRMKARGGNGRG